MKRVFKKDAMLDEKGKGMTIEKIACGRRKLVVPAKGSV
jgi:hypothetical protein